MFSSWLRVVVSLVLVVAIASTLIVYGIAIGRYEVFPFDTLVSAKRLLDRQLTRNQSNKAQIAVTRAPECALDGYEGYCGLIDVGGRLTAATWLSDNHMYIADWDGRIRLLNTGTGEVRTVMQGLSIPQGLTVLDGRLFVSDTGGVCDLMYEYLEEFEDHAGGAIASCRFKRQYIRESWDVVLSDYMSRTNAQILSYDIHASGNLSNRQVVVDKIPIRDYSHSPNGLTNDGEYVYASIGYPESVGAVVNDLTARGRRTDLMGVIIRFRPSDEEVEVFATGFRNVYGISPAADGTIYGADNDAQDGLATGGHREELNAITSGGFYGFPLYGTNLAPPEASVIEPVAVLNGTASTVAYANQDGVYVAYISTEDKDKHVIDRFDYDTFTPTRIFKNGRSYAVAILEQYKQLYIVTLGGYVHILDPTAAPITSRREG